jgi:hypothetical protein
MFTPATAATVAKQIRSKAKMFPRIFLRTKEINSDTALAAKKNTPNVLRR